MISIAPIRILFLVVSFILINHSSQQELFEDAVKRETLAPQLDTSLLSNIDEDDADIPYQEYKGPPNIPAREDEPTESEDESEEEDEDAERRAGNSFDENIDGSNFSQEVPAFNVEDNEDEGLDDENSRAPYNDVESEIDDSAKKRSDLETFENKSKTIKKKTKSKKLSSAHKKSKVKSSLNREKASKKSSVQKRNTKKDGGKVSTNKTDKSKRKKEEDSSISASSSGEGIVGSGNESSGDDESSGAERERRQAFQTEDQVMKAKEKLQNAQEASDALTSIEKEMGLDPSSAPEKTKNLTSALHSEIQKFNDIISQQNDDVKKSKFQKLEKLAEEDVKGANDVMKLIVELEVAKFFAKHRARKKLELALRDKITNPPSPPQPVAPVAPGFAGMGQFQNQAGMADFMPHFQEQNFNAPNPYAPFADEPQQPTPQAPAVPFLPAPQAPQAPYQPYPVAPASFQPAPLPTGPFQGTPPVQNPLQGQYQDSLPPRWSPPVASYAPVPQAPREYNPYAANTMNFAQANYMPQPMANPQSQQQQSVVNNPPVEKPAHKVVKVNPKHKITEKKPQKPAKLRPAQQDNSPQPKLPQPQPQQASYLPQSSPFSGLKPLQSLSPVQHPLPSYSAEMQSQTAPFSSYTQNPFAVSSSHPYSDAFAPPVPQQNTQAFYPQSSWASPPPHVNRFSDSLSHLDPHYQKSAATFKPVGSSPPVKAGQRPHPPDLSKILKDLARYHSRPITAHQFRPAPAVQATELQRLHEPSPPAPQTPPMYSQFDFPGQPEPAIPIQQSAPQFAPPSPQYYQPVPQVPHMPFVSPQPPMPAPLPMQDHAQQMQYFNDQKNNDEDEDEDEDMNPMDQQFNDNPGLQYQGPAVYPQQQQPMQQAYTSYNAWPTQETFSWPQSPNPLPYGYQSSPSYEQIVNPLLSEALNKVHDTKKAASVVQKIENTIGLSPPAVNHIIDDVESETKKEKMQFDQEIMNDEDEIQKDQKLINDEGTNKEEMQKKIEEKKKKLDEDKKRDEVAKTKLASIKKIEKILTIIETAKYSALKRAKEHLLKIKTEKDPQIRKRDLETLEKDLKKSEENHLHRRNEINIWLKGSRNNINTSHFLEGKRKEKKAQQRNYNVFGSPSIPKLAIARFSAKVAKKSKIDSPANSSANASEASKKTVKKAKIGIILMRKLLQRMDDLYDMQSKILTQLIKDHQRAKDEREKDRRKRNIHSAHHRHHPPANHHSHRHHHSR